MVISFIARELLLRAAQIINQTRKQVRFNLSYYSQLYILFFVIRAFVVKSIGLVIIVSLILSLFIIKPVLAQEFTQEINVYNSRDKADLVGFPEISLQSLSEDSASSVSGDGLISFSFQNMSLSYITHLLAKGSGKNIIIHPSAEQLITLHLNQMTFDEILDTILLYTGLQKIIRNDVIFIADDKAINRVSKGPLVTEVITLNYAEAANLISMLESHQFDGGAERHYTHSIGIDERLNQIIITDQRQEVAKIRQLIQKLDQPAKQVEISAYIVAAFDDFAKELGVNWGMSYARGSQNIGGNILQEQAGTGNFGGALGNLTSLGVAVPNFSMAYMVLGNGLNLGLEISAMQSEGRGEMISNPTILTTSRKAAYIKQGTEVSYSTSSNDGTNTEFKEVVMELNVVPQITPNHKIMIDIFISKDEVAGYSPKGEPIIAKKELKTQAIVGHGETIVLGGIYEYENVSGTSEVPFLSQLPFIGTLFKKETNSKRKAELLIFISPRIVDTLIY